MHLAALGELERVGEQVLQDLAQPLRVGDDASSGQSGAIVDRVAEALAPGRPARTRGAGRRAARRARRRRISAVTVPDSTLARSRMLLSSSSSSLPDEWMTLAYSTWVVGHVVVGVVLELLGQDQQAVQRRAQLVRHVGDELGLVLRRDRELAGLLLDEALGLLDLEVLLLGLDVLLGEQRWPGGRGPRSTRAAPPAASAAPRPATATA